MADVADRYGIPTDPGSTTTFVSRGSNKWPAGTEVTTSTIAAMSGRGVKYWPAPPFTSSAFF